MNWSFKFALDEKTEDLFMNKPWLLVDDNIVRGESFMSMQKNLMLERGWDWFRKAIRGRIFPKLNATTFTILESEGNPDTADPQGVVNLLREKFPGLTLVSLIGAKPHVVAGTGYLSPNLLSGIIKNAQKQRWNTEFEKTAMLKTADYNYEGKRPFYKQEFHFEISDVDRYTIDKYFANLAIQETENQYSVGFQLHNSQIGIAGFVQYWHYDKNEFSRAKKTFEAAKEALRKVMTDIEYHRPPMAIITPMVRYALHDIDIDKNERSGNYFFNWSKELPDSEPDWRTTIYGNRYPSNTVQPIDINWNKDEHSKQITVSGKTNRTRILQYTPYTPPINKMAMDFEGLKKMLMAAWGVTTVGAAAGILAWLFSLGITPQELETQLKNGASPQDVIRQVSPQFDISTPVQNPNSIESVENPTETLDISDEPNITRLPRGIRNNNPGNIVRNEIQWNGVSDEQKDKRFLTFKAPEYGIRAMARILRNYQRQHGLRTIAEIIGRWAPEADNNNTESYIQHVSEQLGIPPDSPLDLEDDTLLMKLIKAIIRHENGDNYYDDTTIQRGISLEKKSSKVSVAYRAADWLIWKKQVIQWAQAGMNPTEIGRALAQKGVPKDMIQQLISKVVIPFWGSAYAVNQWRYKYASNNSCR